jgi:hypothetical protein
VNDPRLHRSDHCDVGSSALHKSALLNLGGGKDTRIWTSSTILDQIVKCSDMQEDRSLRPVCGWVVQTLYTQPDSSDGPDQIPPFEGYRGETEG